MQATTIFLHYTINIHGTKGSFSLWKLLTTYVEGDESVGAKPELSDDYAK